MSLKDRMRRLEDKGIPEDCPECRLRPTRTYVINPGGEDKDEETSSSRPIPEPEHCPECGSAIELIVFRLVYEDVEGEGEPY
jgi:hypothetical protein